MSDITLTYKGETIGTMDATGTKTLKTAGKYCEGDIGLAYVKPSVPSTWDWEGLNPTLVSSFPDYTVTLADTDFNTWTPSTTETPIIAADTAVTAKKFQADMANYDYIVKWTLITDLKRITGATLKNTIDKQVSYQYCSLNRRFTGYTGFATKVPDHNTDRIIADGSVLVYYDTNGNLGYAYHESASAGSYSGIYIKEITVSVDSTTADDPWYTLIRPVVYAKCNATNFATARAAELDKATSTLTLKCEVYRVEKPAMLESIAIDIANMFV